MVIMDSTFSNPNESLIHNRFDDDVEINQSYPEDSTLRKSFRRILTKKRIVIISTVVLSILLVIGFTLTGVYVSRGKYAKSFRSNLENHIKSHFSSIDRKLIDSYVNELSQYYEDRYISYDHVVEFETMLKFDKFNKDYNRVHSSNNERRDRFMTFRERYFNIRKHKGHETYSKEVNMFTDMTDKEFNKLFPPVVIPFKTTPKDQVEGILLAKINDEYYLDNLTLAKNTPKRLKEAHTVGGEGLDWRRCNGVTKVKDQGLCGSCWAFASIGSVESLYQIHKETTLDLSEQELVNCDRKSNGCEGGFGDTALEYIKTKGVSKTTDIPYHAIDQECKVTSTDKFFINSFMITKGTDILNKSLVMSPTIVYIAANNELAAYKSGVYNGSCAKDLNHAVLLVGEGYDQLLRKRYWIIKNSWGPYWGEKGYLRLERTDRGSDKCGVLEIGITPTL